MITKLAKALTRLCPKPAYDTGLSGSVRDKSALELVEVGIGAVQPTPERVCNREN